MSQQDVFEFSYSTENYQGWSDISMIGGGCFTFFAGLICGIAGTLFVILGGS